MEHRRRWMYEIPKCSDEFENQLAEFMKVAEVDRLNNRREKICCPCKICQNAVWFIDHIQISVHIITNGFMRDYLCWYRHGEKIIDMNSGVSVGNQVDNDENIIIESDNNRDHIDDMLNDLEGNVDEQYYDKFQQLLVDSEKPLYAGCTKFTKLSAVLKLMNLKANNGWSDTSYTSLLELLHDMLPENNELPISLYRAKKLLCPMGLEVERIHACPNDCLLYRKENKDLDKCSVCGKSRYKRKINADLDDDVKKTGPAAKVLWYFPIIPRLKRLFANAKDAQLLRWHEEGHQKDGKIRHVVDSPQWRHIGTTFLEFESEIRNIRFGLSSDGINPFRDMSSQHSTWPVLLCMYNLPPWLCMNRKYIIMSLLIQGPKQPGNDIDVYLAPLIDDMKTLWNPGVEVHDGYMNENFKLRAMIFCAISDFPAYGNLSGYGTKGASDCPLCEDDTASRLLKYSRKMVYMGH